MEDSIAERISENSCGNMVISVGQSALPLFRAMGIFEHKFTRMKLRLLQQGYLTTYSPERHCLIIAKDNGIDGLIAAAEQVCRVAQEENRGDLDSIAAWQNAAIALQAALEKARG